MKKKTFAVYKRTHYLTKVASAISNLSDHELKHSKRSKSKLDESERQMSMLVASKQKIRTGRVERKSALNRAKAKKVKKNHTISEGGSPSCHVRTRRNLDEP